MTATDQTIPSPFKLCVIDDIRSTVEVIKSKIPWSAYGIEVVGTAKNGQEGLALIRETRPDIIVTDIRMPKMDGLEMTRQIVDTLPRCKIVILSAYADFEYAKQAIKLGAFDFVKKPFAIDELTRVVLDATKALEKERELDRQLRTMERQVQESLPLLRQEYMGRLLRHALTTEEAERYWTEMQAGTVPASFAVLLVEIDDVAYSSAPTAEGELARFAVGHILAETLRQAGGLVCRDGPNEYACLIPCGETDTARGVAETCRASIAEHTVFSVSIGIGKLARSLGELPDAYKSAMAALAFRKREEGSPVFDYASVRQADTARTPADRDKERELEKELLDALRVGDRERAYRALDAIFAEMNRLAPLPDLAYERSLYYELALIVLRSLREWVPQAIVQPYDRAIRGRSGQEQFTVQSFRQLLRDLCADGSAWIERERASDSEKVIYRAIEYIRANLHLDLSIEHCARQMNLSGGYFASLFKKYVGTTFNQFVTGERIERAKQLLIDNYQVQEIAESLGYEHRRYFSDVFKRVTGSTPSEFKDNYRKER
ncbi:two-component system, response regulator YesN [Cohnella sp. OV330]|uniref:response regulator n=1 Tax=Cohnella sp. OV330 TaxID=1855288 RepID=UPI0008EFE573|nr:response regulator [Cohnella sp. OV330]SFB07677.1 two-component system, response regulator YesN [Cohnella sp. OV330]